MNREPVAVANAIRLVLLAAISFGLHLTDVQLIASMAALEAGLTLFTRRAVTPVDSGNVNIEDRLRGDAGRVNWSTVALILLAIVAVLWALNEVPR